MSAPARIRWAILGPGRISHDFAQSLTRSQYGVLYAVGSSSPERARAFADTYGATVSGTYRDVLARDDIDAVYIGTVHTTHAELAIAAFAAGKPVLCEKPASLTYDDTRAVLIAAEASRRPFLEAYKYRFGPLAAAIRKVVESGEIGRPVALQAPYGFEARASVRDGRLFSADVGGGAILDVGCYPVSLAVGIAHWYEPGREIEASLTSLEVSGHSGVDEWARAAVTFGAFEAEVESAITRDLPKQLALHGTHGSVVTDELWGSRSASGSQAIVHRAGAEPRPILVASIDPLAAEADALAHAIWKGEPQCDEMTWSESASVAQLLEQWRDQVRETVASPSR